MFLTLTDDKPVYMPVDQLREYYPNLLGLTSQWLQNGGLEGLTGEQQEKRELLKRGGEKEISAPFSPAYAKAARLRRIRRCLTRFWLR